MSEHRKSYIFCDINCFVKMSVSTLPNFMQALAQKLVSISKRNCTFSFGALILRAGWLKSNPKLRGGGGLKIKILSFSNYNKVCGHPHDFTKHLAPLLY